MGGVIGFYLKRCISHCNSVIIVVSLWIIKVSNNPTLPVCYLVAVSYLQT